MNNYLFDYDRNGNVIDNGKNSFIYNSTNHMTHADVNGRIYDFVYNGKGRRIRSIRHNTNNANNPIAGTKVTNYFFYNKAGKLMYEKNQNTGTRQDHVFANGKAIATRHYYNPAVDTDQDGIPNHYEELYGLQPDNANDALQDSNNDGLNNLQEFNLDTNANSADTDNDGLPDKLEEQYQLNPVSDDGALDADNDGVSNYNEAIAGTSPNDLLDTKRMLDIVPSVSILH